MTILPHRQPFHLSPVNWGKGQSPNSRYPPHSYFAKQGWWVVGDSQGGIRMAIHRRRTGVPPPPP